VAYDLAKDLIVPEAEKALAALKTLFKRFTDKAQDQLKESAGRGALMMAIQAKNALTEVEGAISEALDELNEKRAAERASEDFNEGPKP
jgi:hypothetical protein